MATRADDDDFDKRGPLMVSVAVSKLGFTELIFVETGAKVDGA